MGRLRLFLALALVAAGIQTTAAGAAREPVLSVEPERGIPGQIVVVTGRGLCGSPGCGRVRIQLYSTVVAEGVPVSGGGSFSRRIRVPAGPPTGEVGLIATQRLQNGSELQAFTSFEMALRLRTQQPAKPKQAREAQDGRRNGSDGRGTDRSSERAPDQARGDRALGPPGSPPANSSGAEAASAQSTTGDGGRDRALFAAAATIVLILGTALALVVVASRLAPRRSPE